MDNASSRRYEPADEPLRIPAGDGLQLAATLLGGGGPPVLLAHGFGQTRQSWSATQARLAGDGYLEMTGYAAGERSPSLAAGR